MNPNFALLLALLTSPAIAAGPLQDELVTDRPAHASLELPVEEDTFTFAVFGDRTGGPAEGVRVLEQAVSDVNLVGPDLVMTVGDLIEGYNGTGKWLTQMREFKEIMEGLDCPWFPVAGNHDIYWGGPGAPTGQHEGNYERHFGPLWYAFEHKNAWFIVLYTDEGDPATGRKSFNDPASQRMSTAQFSWLETTLARTTEADHVFVFVHHPRWIESRYGEDWRRIHELLLRNGNVRAVFGGHIHYMRSDPLDGIDYFSLATVGGFQDGISPEAGFLDQYHLVTVRDERIDVAAFPVGAALDPRKISGVMAEDLIKIHRKFKPEWQSELAFQADGSIEGVVTAKLTNPASGPLRISALLTCGDPVWDLGEAHRHLELAAGETRMLRLALSRSGSLEHIAAPRLNIETAYIGDTLEAPIAMRSYEVPLDPRPLRTLGEGAPDGVLVLDGVDDCVAVAHENVPLPDGPFTLEFWVRADAFATRQGLVCKTETSEYGFFANEGVPEFMVRLDDSYKKVSGPTLEPGRWYHLAGVFDGSEIRLYVDGELGGKANASGSRVVRKLPLLVGADVHHNGQGMSFLAGRLDEVHLSTGARYTGANFAPERNRAADDSTVLYLPMPPKIGLWMFDDGPGRQFWEVRGDPRIEAMSEDPSR